MFDKGIISLEDDGKILKADKLIPDKFKSLFNPSGYISLPDNDQLKPHPYFLRHHRENKFVG